VAAARRTRTALEALFPLPVPAATPVAPPAAAPALGLVAKLVATALVGVTLTAGSLHVLDERARLEPAALARPAAVVAPVARAGAAAAGAAAVPHPVVRPPRRRVRRHVHRAPAWLRPRPAGSCTFGTLGVCGAEQ
jgi:hypothetical protein